MEKFEMLTLIEKTMNDLFNILTTQIVFNPFNRAVAAVASIYGVATFLIYTIACYMTFGVTKSISITYYYHNSSKYNFFGAHNLRWLFQAFMLSSAVSIFFIAQNVLYLIVAVLFILMTAFPSVLYRGRNVPHIIYHSTFAVLAISLMLIGLPICYGLGYAIFCEIAVISDVLIAIFVKQKPSNSNELDDTTTRLHWIEVSSILTLIFGLISKNVFDLKL